MHLKISAESAGITTEQVWLTTPDGVQLNAQLYKPTAHSDPIPGIVVCHGLAACHQMMQTSFSLEFARRGFYVVAIDLRGHGDSGGGIEISFNILLGGFPHRDEISVSTFFNVTKVDLDVRTGVDYLLSQTEVDPDKIAILGHSLGGAAVFMEGYSDPRVKSVVAIAPVISLHSGMNQTAPSNLLLAVGGRDGIVRRADLVEVLSRTTGGGEEVGVLYGNFSTGTARQMIVSDGTDHAGEMFDAVIVEQSITWVEASLGIDSIVPISLSPWHRLVIPLLVIASLLSVFPAMLVVKELGLLGNNNSSQKIQPVRMSGKKMIVTYWAAWGGGLLVGMPLQLLGVFKGIPLVYADTFLGIVVTTSLLFFGILLIMRRSDTQFSLNVHDAKTGASLGVCGFLVVFLILNVVFTQGFLDLLPTPRELPLMIAVSCLLLPLTLLEEVWLRTLQLRLSQTPWMKIGIPLTLYLSTKMLPLASVSFIFGNLVLVASSLLFIPILLTTVLFYENGSVVGGAVFNALLYAWILAVVLPFGTNAFL